MNLVNLLKPSLWFNVNPGPLLPSSEKIIIAVIVIMLALAAAGSFFGKRKKDLDKVKAILARKLSRMFFWLGLILAILLFFAREGVPILGMRLWFLLLLLGAFVWLFFIARYAVAEIPKVEKLKKEKERFNKYLPKKKKRK